MLFKLLVLLLLLLFVFTLPPLPLLLLLLLPLAPLPLIKLLELMLLLPLALLPTPRPPPLLAPVPPALGGNGPIWGPLAPLLALILDEMSGMILRSTGPPVTGGFEGLARSEANIWLRSLSDRVSFRFDDGPSSGSAGLFTSMWMPRRCTHSVFFSGSCWFCVFWGSLDD